MILAVLTLQITATSASEIGIRDQESKHPCKSKPDYEEAVSSERHSLHTRNRPVSYSEDTDQITINK